MPPKLKFTKEQIIDAAFHLVRKNGWQALTTRALADALGASARPIYSFFSSMAELEEEIVKKAVALLHDHMSRQRTDDPWHDHGIGYVMFAMEEKQLFRCINDEKHIALFKKYGDIIWTTLTDSLSDYPPFRELKEEQVQKIQLQRWLFAHGLAFAASNPPPDTWTSDLIVSTMQSGSRAIYAGMVQQFDSRTKEVEMGKRDPRKMALQIAGLRANETHLPEEERVFEDPYAEYFFPEDVRKMATDIDWVRAERAKYEAIMPGANGAIAARIRYIDEILTDAIRTGFEQLVIIGAGYDTRAYRIPGAKEHLKVFEIDHPATQEVKINTITEIFNRLPDHVTYLPVVFGQDRLDEKLFQAGYDPGRKTLFVMEGLLMYIPPPAVDGLLSFIGKASAPGSAVVADYFDTSVVDGTSPLKEAQVLRSFVESEGAPLQFGIPEDSVEDFFKQRGFSDATRVTSASCKEKYFKGPSRERAVSPMFNFVYALV